MLRRKHNIHVSTLYQNNLMIAENVKKISLLILFQYTLKTAQYRSFPKPNFHFNALQYYVHLDLIKETLYTIV